MGIRIVQVLIYMYLLIITCLHIKAAVVIKMLVKSSCLAYNFNGLTTYYGTAQLQLHSYTRVHMQCHETPTMYPYYVFVWNTFSHGVEHIYTSHLIYHVAHVEL